MPFYDYVCKNCKKDFEILQAISEDPLEVCPECGDKTLKRLISLPFRGQVEYRNAREMYENKIKPEAKAIAQKIKDGDEAATADILGEDKMFY